MGGGVNIYTSLLAVCINCSAMYLLRFLDDLRARQRQSVLIQSISDIITDHVSSCDFFSFRLCAFCKPLFDLFFLFRQRISFKRMLLIVHVNISKTEL